MRRFVTFLSLGSCLLMTGADAQTPPAPAPTPQVPANACYLWKGRGGAPTASYLATFASCRPWNNSSGWKFLKSNSGVDYHGGTFKDAVATPATWAVYADFGTAAVTTKADFDAFVANSRLSGSCAACLP
ncbi:hypothetical protein MYSTI_04017 [Myxococcus stipitatus DSM 14675]|uniref:Lipoprotein n=1 Tax=Myxococcus stipitatus (strain DSM 14675 / JCM 12634 / Mx s8) TaxID=1278073 RepID=L7UB87_MYXSD|nr:hypothetical protein [Myxococcus stipitatus]AGC45318.1 hypothetical protein MYSTI_04017 [Myxococcus stipitatus DSM 14675]